MDFLNPDTIYLYIFVALALFFFVAKLFLWFFMGRKIRELKKEVRHLEHEKEEEEAIAGNFEEYNERIQELKEARKERVLRFLEDKNKIKTSEVADLFEISRTTAFRYLSELEDEGKIKRIGKRGRNVKYKLNN